MRKDSLPGGGVQSVCIELNKNSSRYNTLTNPQLTEDYKAVYEHSVDFFREKDKPLARYTTGLPWKNWIPAYMYKGKYYVYYPCDFINHFAETFNDTTFTDWYGADGPVANKILGAERVGKNTWVFTLTGEYDTARQLTIHIIDEKRGIAVFEKRRSTTDEPYFYLKIAAGKVRTVPMVVNNCPYQKELEFTFDEPDYARLLGRK